LEKEIQISASIVLYKEPVEILKKTVDCFLKTPIEKQLFLIDNSPTDTLRNQFIHPEITYIFVGKNMGKRKLFESVSPKKTVEGFIGGVVFSWIAAIIIAVNSEMFSVLNWLIIATITSVIGSIGDLIESKFKRQANVKDSGNIMPGHGGMLDRIDSLIAAVPVFFAGLYFLGAV